METKTSYSIVNGNLVEDAAPVVSVAAGAIDTSEPVVHKDSQKKLVRRNRLKTFKEFCEENDAITESVLDEALTSEFPVLRDTSFERDINNGLGHLIHPAHTMVMHSQHMLDNGHSILKLMRPRDRQFKNKTVEYHFVNRIGDLESHALDNLSMLHAMKIIKDDAIKQINLGRTIKFQSVKPKQHEKYMRLANRLAKETGKSVLDVGMTPRLDNGEPARTCIVEQTGLYHSKPFLEELILAHRKKNNIVPVVESVSPPQIIKFDLVEFSNF